ncbi:MAG: hypothetical protein WBQ32_00600 [Ignavibacteriaceae bacterium]
MKVATENFFWYILALKMIGIKKNILKYLNIADIRDVKIPGLEKKLG